MSIRFAPVAKALALSLACALTSCSQLEEIVVGRAAEQAVRGDHDEWLRDGALHAVLCGTGSPLPDPNRAAGCVAVMAGGQFYLVDVGPGSWEQVQLWGLPRAQLSGILLTHFHSDHIGELGEATVQSWIAGRSGELPVYGPPGVEQVVDGFRRAYALDAGYRQEHHGDALAVGGGLAVARPVSLPAADAAAVVLERDGLRITAFAVEHRPASPAYGYRFDYGGRSVVVSGDTARSENLARHAHGADLLVHEALVARLVERLSERLAERGATRLAKMASDIVGYHATPAEAVATAVEAEVSMLVLTHLVPAVPGPLLDFVFLADVDVPASLTVVIGKDGTHFTLPSQSGAIDVSELA
jgi:ribonuclease Z